MKKKHLLLLAAVLLAGTALIYIYSSTTKSFDQIIPGEAKPIQYCVVQWESQETGVIEPETSEQQCTEILSLLDQFQYKREGSTGSIQNCIARLFLGAANQESIELMLTSDLRILVNYLHISNKNIVYEMLPTAEIQTGEQLMNELIRILK